MNLRPKIALYEPDIPQNTAAIIRTCSCLGAMIERRLSDLGDVNVHVVDDPVRLGAMGGLRLAMEVPEEMWKNLTLASR